MPNITRYREQAAKLAHLNAFISFTEETGDGAIIAVKDCINVKGVPTTAGGIILPADAAETDAPVVARVRRAGATVIGKTNLHEWAFGPTSVNPHYGPVRNPVAPDRVAGGSSGGSAVAVATGMCDWAIGTDTGGSIRIPASLCGVVGLKPTADVIETTGTIPLSRTLDTIGPLARDVHAAAEAFARMCADELSLEEVPFGGLKLAVPAEWVTDLDDETARVWNRFAAEWPYITFPERGRLADPGRTIMYFEAADFHRDWLAEQPEKYGDDVRAYLQEGSRIDPADYQAALTARDALRTEVEEALNGFDAIVLPATARIAPLIGIQDVREPLTRFTRPFNTTGHPAIVLPAPSENLPVGIQIVGHHGRDHELINVALSLERAFRRLQPPARRQLNPAID